MRTSGRSILMLREALVLADNGLDLSPLKDLADAEEDVEAWKLTVSGDQLGIT